MTHQYFSHIAWTGNRGEGTIGYRSYDRTWDVAIEGIVVTRYEDTPLGIGEVSDTGAGRFTSATLRPQITLRKGCDVNLAHAIHDRIHEVCFIARSVNFPVNYAAKIS